MGHLRLLPPLPSPPQQPLLDVSASGSETTDTSSKQQPKLRAHSPPEATSPPEAMVSESPSP